MTHGGIRASALLFIGDLATFVAALWLTLLLRYGTLPTEAVFRDHMGPFSLLFALWVLVFYMSGLYSKRFILFKSSLPNAILRTQVINIVMAALFFFLVPGVGIAPKTNLVIYLLVSLALIFAWRLALYPRLSAPRVRDYAVLIAEGEETDELVREVNGNRRYHLEFRKVYTPAALHALGREGLRRELGDKSIDLIVADTDCAEVQAMLPDLYMLPCFEHGCVYADFDAVYEEVFDRIPLSLLSQGWFLENVTTTTPVFHAFVKRVIDLVGGVLMGLVTMVAAPVVWAANLLEGGGPLFTVQDRIGIRGSSIRTYKFRSMRFTDTGMWPGEGENRVTRVGDFLRMTSLDEFPQFVNVLTGELSLIGPRNDIRALGDRLAEALPYYNMRYIVTPGITGWAQINQQYEQGHISPQSIEETKMRLAYDFYYIKHRSLALDIVIALKTFKRMFFRLSNW
ncbi:MAG TPA: sugar transferase [Candidatus Paceibacterota bacterium]|nr:sugar transferase [Candidatus Paceibacterota bacterium]